MNKWEIIYLVVVVVCKLIYIYIYIKYERKIKYCQILNCKVFKFEACERTFHTKLFNPNIFVILFWLQINNNNNKYT